MGDNFCQPPPQPGAPPPPSLVQAPVFFLSGDSSEAEHKADTGSTISCGTEGSRNQPAPRAEAPDACMSVCLMSMTITTSEPTGGISGGTTTWVSRVSTLSRLQVPLRLAAIPLAPPPPRDDGSPPTPRGADTTQWSPEFEYIQLKFFFVAFGACDFLLVSYCSWAK